MNCDYCRAEMKPMFTGYYCPNHCDLPADKKAAAKKKDEEIRASAKPNPTAGSVAAPVSTPVYQLGNCLGFCGKPPNYVSDGLGGYYCDNQVTVFGTRGSCGARKLATNYSTVAANSWNLSGFPTFTINWGGHTINVISDPDCPADKPYFHPTRDLVFANPALIALKKPYPDFQRDGLVPEPDVRADYSPSGKDWREYHAASRCSSYDGYADWYKVGN